MSDSDGFYTLKGYQKNQKPELTAAMEDYLEMIYRISSSNKRVRTVELSQMLHVKPSSVTKMITQLTSTGFVNSQKYGYIQLTDKGRHEGEYLLNRHRILNEFFCALKVYLTLNILLCDNELEQVEKTEHFFSRKSIERLEKWTEIIKNNSIEE